MLTDGFGSLPTASRVEQFRGAVMSVRTDEVVFGEAVHARDYIVHFGAVAVFAMDAEDRVLLISQYRHPMAATMWEIPAGLLDDPEESPLAAAQRELAEEAGFTASDWVRLIDYATTPGGSTEVLRIYLARGLQELEHRPKTDEAEEQDLPIAFVALDDVVSAVLAGTVANTSLVVGALAAAAARNRGFETLAAADTPWPLREHLQANARVFRR